MHLSCVESELGYICFLSAGRWGGISTLLPLRPTIL